MTAEQVSQVPGGLARRTDGCEPDGTDPKAVALSVVITVVGGVRSLRRCLERLVAQINGRAIEILVPYDSTCGEVAALAPEFPEVRFLDRGTVPTACRPGSSAAAHELYDGGKAFGLDRARGDILALLDDTGAPDPDWCDRVLEAHGLPHDVIGGCVEYAGRGLLAWAVYLQDFGRYQWPLAEGPAGYLTDINVSYKRRALLKVREAWQQRYSEATVHWAMARQGVTLWQRPQIVVRQDREPCSLGSTLAERYGWGRLFGSVRARELSWLGRLGYAALSPALPLILIARMARKALGTPQRGGFVAAVPALLLLTAAWSLGELTGYVTGRESSR
jgi:hypothetical protein